SNDRVSEDWAEPAPARRHRRAKPRAAVAAPPPAPVPAETIVTAPPAGWRSSDPRGIIVVPIETPVSIRADVPR
ncbi:MAG TPA: hypothetical protein VLT58_17230, partial [Polyangia bacterium]|nr:hypothetical protein [Polyangia bacterium]